MSLSPLPCHPLPSPVSSPDLRPLLRPAQKALRTALSQTELNEAFVLPEFPVALEWGNLLALLLVSLSYGPGFPALLLIAGARAAAQLLWDRKILGASVRVGKALSPALGLAAAGIMRFGLVVHW